jgi:hypothetical protein
MTPVPELYEMTDAPERDEEEILLLKVDQSAVAKQPKTAAVAVLHVSAPATFARPEPVRDVKYEALIPNLVAYILVEVLFVVVLLIPVKFWRVDEPVASRLANVPRPAADTVPVKLAAELMV